MIKITALFLLTAVVLSGCSKKRPASEVQAQALDRGELVPAETVLYGSVDSKVLAGAGQTTLNIFPKFDAQVSDRELSWNEYKAKIKKIGIDFDKVGQTNFLGIALPSGDASKASADFELVFLMLEGQLPKVTRWLKLSTQWLDERGDSQKSKVMRAVSTTLNTLQITHKKTVLRIRADAPYSRVVAALAMVAASLMKGLPFGREHRP